MLDMARRHRSIAFIGEEPTARTLKRWVGASDRDCREMVVRGCYEFEKVLSDVNPACLMTLATEHALKMRRDGFATGCPRGNNTTILSVGLGTAVDALLAVKELVFEKKEITLAQLGAIMASNWWRTSARATKSTKTWTPRCCERPSRN